MGYLPYLMMGNFDDKPLDFMFFPLLFFQTSQQFGIPSSTARQVLSLRFSRTSLGQTDHRGWGPSKARPQQEKEQVMGWDLIWESCQLDIYNLHISEISDHPSVVTTVLPLPRNFPMFHDVFLGALREICVTRPEDGG